MFLPPAVMMMSFRRSVMRRYPSSSKLPTSPVRSHPSTTVSSVFSGRLSYPMNTCGPRTRISPCGEIATSP
jgi:hypothetical protein